MTTKPFDRRTAERRIDDEGLEAMDRRQGDRRQGSERRQVPRLPVELWVEEIAGDASYLRRTANLSEGGLLFGKALPHPLETIVKLKFSLPGQEQPILASGAVVSAGATEDGLGMGIEFISIEGDGQQRIRKFLASR